MTCILSYWTWIDSHWPNKYVWVDGWMTGGKWAYLMMCQQSVYFKWSLKGPRMGIFPKCRRIRWKWWTDAAWSCVYWEGLPGLEPCGIIYGPAPAPRALQDSMLDLHNQVNACFGQIWAQRTPAPSGMDVCCVLPSKYPTLQLRQLHFAFLSSF